MKRKFAIKRRIEHGIMKRHWIILMLAIAGLIGFGLFKCACKTKLSVLPEAELCEVLYQID